MTEARKKIMTISFFELQSFEEERKNMKFDTIVSMAVIEHVKNPKDFLINLGKYLKDDGKIILTTPHPKADWIYDLGSKIGLFSSHTNEEHEELVNEKDINFIIKNESILA